MASAAAKNAAARCFDDNDTRKDTIRNTIEPKRGEKGTVLFNINLKLPIHMAERSQYDGGWLAGVNCIFGKYLPPG